MKTRRHHNNKGTRQVKRGKTASQLKQIAFKMGVGFRVGEVISFGEYDANKFRIIGVYPKADSRPR